MRGTVVVEAQDDFEAWLQEQPTFAQSLALVRDGKTDVSNLDSSETVLDSAGTEITPPDSVQ
jgi:heme/copper-type cytochrome/quinol oxidase subunit 2